MIPAALAAVALLAAGALLTAWLEPRLPRPGAGAGEPGPAGPVPVRRDVRPERPDPWLYAAAPVVATLGVCWAMVTIPFGRQLIATDVNTGVFYYLVAVDFVVLGIALGGWGADTPDSVEACYRIVAQLVSYVVPLGLAVLGPIMMARSLSVVDIVEAQNGAGLWYAALQPLGFALYVGTALMQAYRAPFLEPFADRIGRGVLGVFGAWKALLWRVALSGLLFVVSAMGAALFLGGYGGPWLPGPVWMSLKTVGLMAFLVWAGRRVRPLSTAEMLALAWKMLIPVGLVNVLVVGGLILLGVGQEPFRRGGG